MRHGTEPASHGICRDCCDRAASGLTPDGGLGVKLYPVKELRDHGCEPKDDLAEAKKRWDAFQRRETLQACAAAAIVALFFVFIVILFEAL